MADEASAKRIAMIREMAEIEEDIGIDVDDRYLADVLNALDAATARAAALEEERDCFERLLTAHERSITDLEAQVTALEAERDALLAQSGHDEGEGE